MLLKKSSLRVNEINPFLASILILYTLKTLENLRFFDVFRGYKMRTLAKNGLQRLKLKSTISFEHNIISSSLPAPRSFSRISQFFIGSCNHMNFQKEFSVTLGIGKMKLK